LYRSEVISPVIKIDSCGFVSNLDVDTDWISVR
jgi:hypothetical protein